MQIQDILSLPRTQQIAIVQAILAQWQVEEVREGEWLEERQVDAAARIAAEADAGNMPVLTLEAWKARVEERRKDKQV
jgi:hypothetical protein